MAARSERHSAFACESVHPSWTQTVPTEPDASQNLTCAQPVAGTIAVEPGLGGSAAVASSDDVDGVSIFSLVEVSDFAPAAGGSFAGSSAQADMMTKSKHAIIDASVAVTKAFVRCRMCCLLLN